eukprot:CAMPEP_0168842180 /NCGR_PEP_ID=MMETSP0727-20121128/7557_1 /TAXON_ID=265536 /ORGANISM="Amphiprora sp., Strain CCMP467" /LENGTH=255 /DNA_ID=CAMNT_0008895721 /DNA_START=42 /DNA_END=807 /DNA_ORIENTATION=+
MFFWGDTSKKELKSNPRQKKTKKTKQKDTKNKPPVPITKPKPSAQQDAHEAEKGKRKINDPIKETENTAATATPPKDVSPASRPRENAIEPAEAPPPPPATTTSQEDPHTLTVLKNQETLEIQALAADDFAKYQRALYHHRARGRHFECCVVGVHDEDDGPNYYTIQYCEETEPEGESTVTSSTLPGQPQQQQNQELVEKQTTRDRLQHVSWDKQKTLSLLKHYKKLWRAVENGALILVVMSAVATLVPTKGAGP